MEYLVGAIFCLIGAVFVILLGIQLWRLGLLLKARFPILYTLYAITWILIALLFIGVFGALAVDRIQAHKEQKQKNELNEQKERFSSSLKLNEPDTTQALCKFYLNYIDSNDYENAIYTARSRHPDFKKNYDEAMSDSELSESFLHDRVIQYANDVGNEGLCNPAQI